MTDFIANALKLPNIFLDDYGSPWVLAGFSEASGNVLILDPQRLATAIIAGPTNVNEGALTQWDCNASDSRDINEDFTCTWDFGDGTGDFGKSVTHTYDDNAGSLPADVYVVTLVVDDGHTELAGEQRHSDSSCRF